MDKIEKQHILENVDFFIKETEYSELLSACSTEGLLSFEMVKKIDQITPTTEDQESHQREKHRRLLTKITQRGPTAYKTLKKICAYLQYENALNKLENIGNKENNAKTINSINAIPSWLPLDGPCFSKMPAEKALTLQPYAGEIKCVEGLKIQFSEKIHTCNVNGTYKMESSLNRGILFIANEIDFPISPRRDGSEEDEKALIYLFHQLQFKIFCYRNLTVFQFFNLLEQLLRSDYARETECFFLALLTHGINKEFKDFVEFSDGNQIHVEDILEKFDNGKCESLAMKPKIFILPCCRGRKSEKPIRKSSAQIGTDSIRFQEGKSDKEIFLSTRSDILVCYGTLHGFASHRNGMVTGSWYIQEFCKTMAKIVHNTDFEAILKEVSRNLIKQIYDERMQTPNFVNVAFNKKLYFNPGMHLY